MPVRVSVDVSPMPVIIDISLLKTKNINTIIHYIVHLSSFVFTSISVRASCQSQHHSIGGMMANGDINVYIIAIRCPADLLQRRSGPVRYVTTQEKTFYNRPVPGDHQFRHRRLSPVTLFPYAALCTVGHLARKIS